MLDPILLEAFRVSSGKFAGNEGSGQGRPFWPPSGNHKGFEAQPAAMQGDGLPSSHFRWSRQG